MTINRPIDLIEGFCRNQLPEVAWTLTTLIESTRINLEMLGAIACTRHSFMRFNCVRDWTQEHLDLYHKPDTVLLHQMWGPHYRDKKPRIAQLHFGDLTDLIAIRPRPHVDAKHKNTFEHLVHTATDGGVYHVRGVSSNHATSAQFREVESQLTGMQQVQVYEMEHVDARVVNAHIIACLTRFENSAISLASMEVKHAEF